MGVKGQVIVWGPRMGMEGLVWVWLGRVLRALDGWGGTGTDLDDLEWAWDVGDGYRGSRVSEEGLELVWRVWTFQTHPRLSRSLPIPPHPPKARHTHPSPFPYTRCPHTHQSPSQALHTHLKPFTPISGIPHPTKALHNHTKPSIPILGPTLFIGPLHPP